MSDVRDAIQADPRRWGFLQGVVFVPVAKGPLLRQDAARQPPFTVVMEDYVTPGRGRPKPLARHIVWEPADVFAARMAAAKDMWNV